MQDISIRPAEEADLAVVDTALQGLARDLEDPYRVGTGALRPALFGTPPVAFAQIADGNADVCGLVLFSPVFSTAIGGAGLYVSDLWVNSSARGRGLGPALLQSAAERAEALWGAVFMRLAVYRDNPRARGLYDELGFDPVQGETLMVLRGEAFQNIRRPI